MLPCFCADSRSDPAACVSATQTEEGFHVIEAPLYRIETVRRFHVPGHTDYRDLRRSARQHRTGTKKRPRRDDDPPPAERSCPNGPPNAQPIAGLVLRYEAGCFFVFAYTPIRCRGPPPLCLRIKIRQRRLPRETAK